MIRNTPQPGDIGLVPIFGFVGLLIRIGQWLNGDGFANFEHVFIVLEDGMLIEAQPGGAVIRPLSDYSDRPIVYVSPEGLTAGQRKAICDIARTFEGTPYSFVDYAAIGAHRIHLPLPGLQEFIEDSGHLICSQLVDEVYRLAGAELFSDGRWAGWVTPVAIHNRLAP
jgi:cell wall-associated NlpC family hydrolase